MNRWILLYLAYAAATLFAMAAALGDPGWWPPALWAVAAALLLAAPLAVFGWFVVLGYRDATRDDRVRRRRCARCDYSLRGNASGVCPECGAPVPPRSTVA